MKFFACNETDREWDLDYSSSGKGIIPYEMIERLDSLDVSLEKGNIFYLIIVTLASKIQ